MLHGNRFLSGPYWSSEGAVSAGGGARINVSPRCRSLPSSASAGSPTCASACGSPGAPDYNVVRLRTIWESDGRRTRIRNGQFRASPPYTAARNDGCNLAGVLRSSQVALVFATLSFAAGGADRVRAEPQSVVYLAAILIDGPRARRQGRGSTSTRLPPARPCRSSCGPVCRRTRIAAADGIEGRLLRPLTTRDGFELVPAGAVVLGTVQRGRARRPQAAGPARVHLSRRRASRDRQPRDDQGLGPHLRVRDSGKGQTLRRSAAGEGQRCIRPAAGSAARAHSCELTSSRSRDAAVRGRSPPRAFRAKSPLHSPALRLPFLLDAGGDECAPIRWTTCFRT